MRFIIYAEYKENSRWQHTMWMNDADNLNDAIQHAMSNLTIEQARSIEYLRAIKIKDMIDVDCRGLVDINVKEFANVPKD